MMPVTKSKNKFAASAQKQPKSLRKSSTTPTATSQIALPPQAPAPSSDAFKSSPPPSPFHSPKPVRPESSQHGLSHPSPIDSRPSSSTATDPSLKLRLMAMGPSSPSPSSSVTPQPKSITEPAARPQSSSVHPPSATTDAPKPARTSLAATRKKPSPELASSSKIQVDDRTFSAHPLGQQGMKGKVYGLRQSQDANPSLVLKTGQGIEHEAEMLKKAEGLQNVVQGGKLVEVGPNQKGVVMEALAGGTLTEKHAALRQQKPSDLNQRKPEERDALRKQVLGGQQRAIRDMVNGTAELNQKGVVHNDLKPDNVLMGSDGRFKLADLGESALKGSGERHTQTHLYTDPGSHLSAGSEKNDAYGVGGLVYRLTKGKHPTESGVPKIADPRPKEHEDPSITKTKAQRNDLIARLTDPDPNKRLTAQQAQSHPYISGAPLIEEKEAREVLKKTAPSNVSDKN